MENKNLCALSTAIETHAIDAIDRHVENMIATYGAQMVREVLEMKCVNMKQAEKPDKKKIAK